MHSNKSTKHITHPSQKKHHHLPKQSTLTYHITYINSSEDNLL